MLKTFFAVGVLVGSVSAAAAENQDLIEHAHKYAPFSDKTVISVKTNKSWEKKGKAEHLEAAVTVFDPANYKCWLWKKVTFSRQDGGMQAPHPSTNDNDIAEVDCKKVGFKVPAGKPQSRGGASNKVWLISEDDRDYDVDVVCPSGSTMNGTAQANVDSPVTGTFDASEFKGCRIELRDGGGKSKPLTGKTQHCKVKGGAISCR